MTNLIPELNSWFNRFVKNSSVNKNQITIPTEINDIYLPPKSFIELLFNESYSYSEYYYKYNEDTNRYSWPNIVKTRMLIYPSAGKYYKCAETGDNSFNLNDEDLVLLNALLQYRQDSTSVTIIDSIEISFVDNVLYASYSNISSNLAKLIFLYLELKIYGRTSNYDNQILISSFDNILENMYESLVSDEIFTTISIRGV